MDYALAEARTTYGAIGVKVWIYRGKFGEEPEPVQNRRRRPRREGGAQVADAEEPQAAADAE